MDNSVGVFAWSSVNEKELLLNYNDVLFLSHNILASTAKYPSNAPARVMTDGVGNADVEDEISKVPNIFRDGKAPLRFPPQNCFADQRLFHFSKILGALSASSAKIDGLSNFVVQHSVGSTHEAREPMSHPFVRWTIPLLKSLQYEWRFVCFYFIVYRSIFIIELEHWTH